MTVAVCSNPIKSIFSINLAVNWFPYLYYISICVYIHTYICIHDIFSWCSNGYSQPFIERPSVYLAIYDTCSEMICLLQFLIRILFV